MTEHFTREEDRTAFEAAYARLYPIAATTRTDKFEMDGKDLYSDMTVQVAWNLWNAAVSAKLAEWEKQEPIGQVVDARDDAFKCEFSGRLAVGTKLYTHPLTAQTTEQHDHLQDIAAAIGVGGYNGATTDQLAERILSEFQRLSAMAVQPAEPVNAARVEALKRLTKYTFDSTYCGAVKNTACRCSGNCQVFYEREAANDAIFRAHAAHQKGGASLPDWMREDAEDVQALMDRDMGDN